MTALLICPAERPEVAWLSQGTPLGLVPAVGQNLLEYWLAHLAGSGFNSVIVLAHEQPERVLQVVGNGARWGLSVEVIPESRELTPAQALIKYGDKLEVGRPDASVAVPASAPGAASASGPTETNIYLLDRFPGFARILFGSYSDFVQGLVEQIPVSCTPERVGIRETRPGIYIGIGAYIDPRAILHAPCWIGDHVYVGAHAALGPGAVVEAGSFIEPQAEVATSYIGPDTFVGRYARIVDSLAVGSTLVDWQSGSATQVPDPFLLCALRSRRKPPGETWLGGLLDLYTRKAEVLMACKHLLVRKES